MVKIRLTRTGKKHEPHYRIVATDSRKSRDGKYLEKIGYYNPRTKPPTLEYDKEILQKWMDRGAQMTDTIHDIFVKEGVVKQTGKRKARLDIITKPEERTPEEETEKPEEPAKEKDDKKKEKPVKEEEKKEETPEAGKPEDAAEEAKTNDKPEKSKEKESKK